VGSDKITELYTCDEPQINSARFHKIFKDAVCAGAPGLRARPRGVRIAGAVQRPYAVSLCLRRARRQVYLYRRGIWDEAKSKLLGARTAGAAVQG
jgi:hypothetical protein